MTKKKLTLDQFAEKVGAEAPEFARALREEDAYLQFCKKVREDLRQLREDMGVKQSEVAAELQISQPGISKIEKGEGDIGLLTLCRYAGALGMQPSISFAPAASTYLQQDTLKTTLRAMERLAETHVARADDAMYARYKALAAEGAPAEISDSAWVGFMAAAMSSAVKQSMSTEIASLMSRFSEFRPEDKRDSKRSVRADFRAAV
jgi:transcriptional regulator with XRE-family HTH domain